MNTEKYIPYFIEETSGLIPMMKHSLKNDETEVLMRHIHTIRGSSAMIGLKQIAEVSAIMEDFLKKRGSVSLKENKDLLSDCIDYLDEQISILKEGRKLKTSELVQRFQKVMKDD